MSSKGTYVRQTTDYGIATAFAERFDYSVKVVGGIGTDQLCRCKSDEARRILLSATAQEREAAKKANLARQGRRALKIKPKARHKVDVDRLVELASKTRVAA